MVEVGGKTERKWGGGRGTDMKWMGRKSAGRKVKDERVDTGIKVWRRAGGGLCPPQLCCVCSSGLAGKGGGGWVGGWVEGVAGGLEGPKNLKTLHLHEFDRPLENTRATFENATPRKVKWHPRGGGTCSGARPRRLPHSGAQGLSLRKRCPDKPQHRD